MKTFKRLFTLLLVLAVAWVATPALAANVAYTRAYQAALEGTIDLDVATAGTFKVALIASTYTPDPDHTDFTTQIQAYECSGTGYTAGGANLDTAGAPDVSLDTTNNWAVWDAGDVTWSTITISGVRYGLVYHVATGIPISCKDFTTDKSASGGDFVIQWAAPASGGIAYVAMP